MIYSEDGERDRGVRKGLGEKKLKITIAIDPNLDVPLS